MDSSHRVCRILCCSAAGMVFPEYCTEKNSFHYAFQNETCTFQNKQVDSDHIWYLLILKDKEGEEQVQHTRPRIALTSARGCF